METRSASPQSIAVCLPERQKPLARMKIGDPNELAHIFIALDPVKVGLPQPLKIAILEEGVGVHLEVIFSVTAIWKSSHHLGERTRFVAIFVS